MAAAAADDDGAMTFSIYSTTRQHVSGGSRPKRHAGSPAVGPHGSVMSSTSTWETTARSRRHGSANQSQVLDHGLDADRLLHQVPALRSVLLK